jgi:hypothetical protein
MDKILVRTYIHVNHILKKMRERSLFLISLTVIILTVDAVISNTADFITEGITSIYGVTLFFAIIWGNAFLQNLILHFIQKNVEKILAAKYLNSLHKLVRTIQWVLIVLTTVVGLEIAITSIYDSAFLTAVTAISYGLAIALLSFLSLRFFYWLRSNRSYVVLLYTLSSFALVVMALFSIMLMCYILITKEGGVTPETPVIYPAFEQGSLERTLSDYYVLGDIISFSLIWISTATVLRHYSTRLGSLRYWTVVTLPLVYFASNFFDLIPGFEFLDDFTFIAITTLNSSAGGILFAIVFWKSSNKIDNYIVREYLKISAYGFVLWFTCNQASVIAASYPPFGLAAVSTMGLASYLISIGIYYSAVSVAQDNIVRGSIRKSTIRELKLFGDIGFSEMYDQIKKNVISVENNSLEKMTDKSGVQTAITQDDIELYVNEVLKELRKNKEKNLR